ncbi:hypothetical protein [Chlorobaculum sp. 24CR]|uniref:hypothetical protein n=1 Tax=Chlorobaculum sp. 24CR TaxID=2508878 RepID=UPI001ADCE631|nr:hypothetical protein [Chlorobaculum sp. 24CR]
MPIQSRYTALNGDRHRSIDTGGNALVMLLLHGISSTLDDDDPSVPLLARISETLFLSHHGVHFSGTSIGVSSYAHYI